MNIDKVKVVSSDTLKATFKHANGRRFNGKVGECYQALKLFTSKGEHLTDLPLSGGDGYLREQDLSLACSVISSIVKTEEVIAKAKRVKSPRGIVSLITKAYQAYKNKISARKMEPTVKEGEAKKAETTEVELV